jgi:hypothetical protein
MDDPAGGSTVLGASDAQGTISASTPNVSHLKMEIYRLERIWGELNLSSTTRLQLEDGLLE